MRFPLCRGAAEGANGWRMITAIGQYVCGKVITIPNPTSASDAVMDVSRDEADSERKKAARQLAMGPAGFMVRPKRGFFARLFGRK